MVIELLVKLIQLSLVLFSRIATADKVKGGIATCVYVQLCTEYEPAL
jgi:hypothetical protein